MAHELKKKHEPLSFSRFPPSLLTHLQKITLRLLLDPTPASALPLLGTYLDAFLLMA